MKIIHVAGASNSGKTTFIKTLIPALEKKWSVAVVKHLGDHSFALEKGKDTTEFFNAGAAIVVGIDAEKSVAVIRTTSLDDILRFLDEEGTDYVILEGFKTRLFKKIVIGDLEADNCIMRNPSITEVITNLHLFEDFQPDNRSTKTRRRGLL